MNKSINSSILFLWKTSRPRFWFYLLGPWLIGSVIAASRPAELTGTALFWLGIFVFSWPANFFLYGINDYADRDTDALNSKKAGYENRLRDSQLPIVTIGIAIALMLLISFAVMLPVASAAALACFLLLAAGYSLPPLRFKARPIIDAYSNFLYALPAFISAGLLAPLAINPYYFWMIIIGLLTWNAGMHTYSAIPDIDVDAKAGLTTTAVRFGRQRALLFVLINWIVAAVMAILTLGWSASIFLFYPVFAWTLRRFHLVPGEYYRFFPYINGILGLYLYWLLVSQKFPFTLIWQDTQLLFQR